MFIAVNLQEPMVLCSIRLQQEYKRIESRTLLYRELIRIKRYDIIDPEEDGGVSIPAKMLKGVVT